MTMDATQNAQDWFGGLGSAAQGGGGNYFTPGTYLAEIVTVARKVSQDPKKKSARMIVGELRIVEVLAALPADGEFAASKCAGEVCAVICNLDSAYPSLDMGRLRGLIEAAAGKPADTSDAGWGAYAAKVTEPPGTALATARVIVQAGKTRTRAGKAISPLTFSAAP